MKKVHKLKNPQIPVSNFWVCLCAAPPVGPLVWLELLMINRKQWEETFSLQIDFQSAASLRLKLEKKW